MLPVVIATDNANKNQAPFNDVSEFVIFTLNEQRCALRLFNVDKVLQTVEITPSPEVQDIVLGVVNISAGGNCLEVRNERHE